MRDLYQQPQKLIKSLREQENKRDSEDPPFLILTNHGKPELYIRLTTSSEIHEYQAKKKSIEKLTNYSVEELAAALREKTGQDIEVYKIGNGDTPLIHLQSDVEKTEVGMKPSEYRQSKMTPERLNKRLDSEQAAEKPKSKR